MRKDAILTAPSSPPCLDDSRRRKTYSQCDFIFEFDKVRVSPLLLFFKGHD